MDSEHRRIACLRIKKLMRLKFLASEEEEDQGLDEPEHGTLAYPEMAPQTSGTAPDSAGAD